MKNKSFIGLIIKLCYPSILLQFFTPIVLTSLVVIVTCADMSGQCTNTINFPGTITASVFSDTVTVSPFQNAGQYYVIKGLSPGDTYVFMSSNPGDYITIQDRYNNSVLNQGNTPLTYTIDSDDVLSININLQSPECGDDANVRTTKVVCNTCPDIPPSVGVGTIAPVSDLEVNGILKLGDSNRPETAGMIRWNDDSKDFEGYTGSQWVSLTKGRTNWGASDHYNSSENSKLTAALGEGYAHFGFSVSISGDYAVVGAPNIGKAYIFKRNNGTWVEQDDLYDPDSAAYSYYGFSVSISGDYAIVGAPYDEYSINDNDSGSASIFVRVGSNWSFQQKLGFYDGYDNFGYSVSISGNYVIVGAPNADFDGNSNQGSVYIYKRNGDSWSYDEERSASDGDVNDNFGHSVSIFGGNAIVGAPLDDTGGNVDQGSAYIFEYDLLTATWTEEAKLTAWDGEASDKFGTSVSISIGGLSAGNYAIVGSRLDNIYSNVNQGSAYIYKLILSSWTQEAKITASDGTVSDQFGSSVSISGEYVIVGAPLDDIGSNSDQGSAYIFKRNDGIWTEQAKLTATDGGANDEFGVSVSFTGDFTIIGARYDDININGIVDVDRGSAYLFHK